ncbi:MAG: electron transfer flavoprotein subunit beta/FixA family protein, partial [Smithellaceae bacterium]|nr:electron transfer flavoprotein subunit beta/FixA family protein [Smithellaceae bacterium]
VCIKQVSDPDGPLALAGSGREVVPAGKSPYRMNHFDEYALEEAFLIGDAFPGVTVDAISVGPARVETTLRKALELGAGQGIHLRTASDHLLPVETASHIAGYVRDKGYDLILTGAMAEDDLAAQVGPTLAELLEWPAISFVIAEKLSPDRKSIYVEQEREGGLREAFSVDLPAVLSLQSGINRPRYPRLSQVLKARNQPLTIVAAGETISRKVQIASRRFFEPPRSAGGVILTGTPREKAARLWEIITSKALEKRHEG